MGYALLREKAPLGQKVEDLGLHLENVLLSDCCVRGKSAANDECASGAVLPGQYFDQETNLHYNHFRYYDPELGRYITSDPIGLDGGKNTYSYANQNSVRFYDILGLKVTCQWIVQKYYNKTTPKLLQPELGYNKRECVLLAGGPTSNPPDPYDNRERNSRGRGKGRGGPALDFQWRLDCYNKWIVTQEAVWGQDVERWMQGYMRCTDSCTGKVTNHKGSDRPANNPPDIS